MCQPKCISSCYKKCLFCSRVSLKFKCVRQNKICQQCFFCRSITTCPTCSKCLECCRKFSCRGKITTILEDLGQTGGLPQGHTDVKGGLYLTFPTSPFVSQNTNNSQWLCTCSQEPQPDECIACTARKELNRTGQKPKLSGVLQSTVLGSQTEQQMAANSRPQYSEQIPQGHKVQNGDPRDHTNVTPTRGMGDFSRFQGCLFPYPHSSSIQKVSEISCTRSILSVQGTTFRSLHSSYGVHHSSKGGQVDGPVSGHKNPPVPRRLVDSSQVPPNLSQTNSGLSGLMSRSGLESKLRKIRVATHSNLQLCRLPIRPSIRKGQTHTREMADSSNKNSPTPSLFTMQSTTAHVFDRPSYCDRKASSTGSSAYETYPVASEKSLENSRISRKIDSNSSRFTPTSGVVVKRAKCPRRSTITSPQPLFASLYRRLKRRLGRSLKRPYRQGHMVRTRKQNAHKFTGTESSVPSPESIPAPLRGSSGSDSHRQHHGGCLYQQTRGDEVRPIVCPLVENTILVHQKSGVYQGTTYPRSPKCSSGQTVKTRTDYSDRVVSTTRHFPGNLSQVAQAPSGPFCHQVQQQVGPICQSSTRPPGMGSRCSEPLLGGAGPICLSTDSHFGQSSGKTQGLPMPENDPNCPGVAQNDLVLGLGGHVRQDSPVPAGSAQPVTSTVQQNTTRESPESESTCMAPRATAIKEQGFSEAVATRIEAPQRGSTRRVYEAKWAIFTGWCKDNKVDIRTPPLKSIADFLLYLFEVKNLQPGTIEGYRSAIADKLGNSPTNISKNEDLTRLLDSFHRDRPKGRRGVPSWNLSLVMHQLTKAPFEPLHEASLKHLTFKTVFLLALGSGKRRSEIHAWLNKNMRHQKDWSQVSLSPSASFLSKNQLAKEGPNSVATVVIPALAPTLDRTFTKDRSLCPVRALRYYLDKTEDIRQGKELIFVSFKKGFTKDISPATISSWIKQTVILCYQLSDKKAQDLHQVKAHDVRAFAASKAFHSGASLEQVLSACHWKSHNTFTQFYLKDVAWADSELYHLGPMVAAQQIHK